MYKSHTFKNDNKKIILENQKRNLTNPQRKTDYTNKSWPSESTRMWPYIINFNIIGLITVIMTNIQTINQNVAVIINLNITGLFSVVMTDVKNTNNVSNK